MLPLTIFDCQTAFVQGRQILEAILVAFEAFEDCRVNKKKGVLLKLDLEKAYDKVSWDFLDVVLDLKALASLRGDGLKVA